MNQKKKLLHIVESMGGGVFTYMVDICNFMCDEYDVYLAYGLRNETPNDYMDYFDKRVHMIKVENFTREIALSTDFRAVKEVRRIVKDIEPDIVHLHSSKAGAIGRMFLNGKYKKFYTPHGYSFLMQNIDKSKKNQYYLIEKMLGFLKCTTIACGPGEYEVARKITKNAICICNGINVDIVKKEIEEIKAQKNSKEPDDEINEKFTVVTIGRICEQKNPKLFNQIAKQLPDVRFIWIGDGEKRDELTSKNIEVTGWLERGEALLNAVNGDAFVLTSLWEGLPISLLEAMYLKKICIVSDVIGNRDVIRDEINGYVCNDADQFVKVINKVMESSEENENIIKRAYNDLMRYHDTNQIMKMYKETYSK